jgi:hypothetical protein
MHLFEALTSHSARICVMALNDRVSGLREFGSALVNFLGLVLCAFIYQLSSLLSRSGVAPS